MTGDPDPPRYVLATSAQASTVLRRLSHDGWATREGFTLADHPCDPGAARVVLFGRVPDLRTVRQVVSAAARGAGVVAIADAAEPVGRALIDDLSQLGPLGRDPQAAAPETEPVARLVPEQRALLDRLAAGETIAAAAAGEFLSLRTANRRIAQARQLFGVRTTREAVTVYLRQRGDS